MSDNDEEEWEALRQGFGSLDDGAKATSTAQETAVSLELARTELINAAPHAAAQIVNLMRYANNERVRLDSAKYVLDRTLGPVGQKMDGAKSPLETLLDGTLFQEAENYANGAHTQNQSDGE